MEFREEKQGNYTFLTCDVTGYKLDDFFLKMYEKNRMPFLVPFNLVRCDEKVFLQYDISGLRAESSELSGVFTEERLNSFISGYINACAMIEDYMLELDNVLFEQDRVFFERINDVAMLIYVPVIRTEEKSVSPFLYLAELLSNIGIDEEDVRLEKMIDQIVEDINNGTIADLTGLKSIQKQINSGNRMFMQTENEDEEEDDDSGSRTVYRDRRVVAPLLVSPEPEPAPSRKISLTGGAENKRKKMELPTDKKPDARGSKVIPGAPRMAIPNRPDVPEASEPQVMTPPVQKNKSSIFGGKHKPEKTAPMKVQQGTAGGSANRGYLEKPDTGKRYPVITAVFTIGRDESSDLCINDSDISQEHAQISKLGKNYTIKDMKSTNGTYLNGSRLNPMEDVPVCDGDVIEFFEDRYIFHTF